MAKTQAAEQSIAGLAQGDPAVLETLTQMTAGTLERSGLDEKTFMLVRMAALVASDAAPVSYLANLGVAAEAGVTLDMVLGTMVAVAPVVGTAPHYLGGIEDDPGGCPRRTAGSVGQRDRRPILTGYLDTSTHRWHA